MSPTSIASTRKITPEPLRKLLRTWLPAMSFR
jgi:hypothetical protein